MLQVCYRQLYTFGVLPEDVQVGNSQLLDGKIIALDLERVEFDVSAEDNAFYTNLHIEDLADRYRGLRAYYRHEGLLEAA